MIVENQKFSLKDIAFAPFAAVALAALVIVGHTALAWAQSAASQSPATPVSGFKMAFDVASVKPNQPGEREYSNVPLTPGATYPPTGGLFSATNYPLIAYIAFAYDFRGDQLLHLLPQLPRWVTIDRFDIQARAQGNPTKDQIRLMLKSLLADRFKLTIHNETKEGPVYALVLLRPGKTGPQLQAHSEDGSCSAPTQAASGMPPPSAPSSTSGLQLPPLVCGNIAGMQASAPGRMRLGARSVTMGLIANYLPLTSLGGSGVDRPVLDRAGLSGTFDFAIEFTPELNGAPPPNFQPDTTGPMFLEALQEQLGLKLEPTTGPISVFVIDHVEQPSPN